MRTISEVLDRAAEDILRYGWTRAGIGNVHIVQGWHPNPWDTTPRCIEGGIYGATQDGELLDLAIAAVADYLGRSPYRWNDVPGRTVDEVVHVLRVVAALEAAREREAVTA